MFRVNEIFRSIQGEGPAIGQPATFIRLSGCNLACTYCDTRHDDWQEKGLEELLAEVGRGPSRVIITGGEPLLAGDSLVPLAAAIKGTGRSVDLETNGTVPPPPGLAAWLDNFVVSPKLSASGNDPQKAALAAGLPPGPFKFVAGGIEDLDEIQTIAGRHPEREIIVMPLGTEREEMLQRMDALRAPVEARGWRLLPRLHVLLGIR